MAWALAPMNAISPEMLREYFVRTGMPAAVVEWRYFDERFNRGRNRGYVWHRDGRVEGAIGLVPCTLARGGQSWPMDWSCDWGLARPDKMPGFGVRLLNEAIANCEHLITVGGNENTRKLLPRIAAHTVLDAGVQVALPLRVGAVRTALTRTRRLPIPAWFDSLPMKWLSRPPSGTQVRTEAGVARCITPLLALSRDGQWHPRYDYEYVDWQVGRSPVLSVWTAYAPADREPDAAVVFWRLKDSSHAWRLATWWRAGATDLLKSALKESIWQIYQQGAHWTAALASHNDVELIAILGSLGFYRRRATKPLFICLGPRSQPVTDLAGLSFLDTDFAYRF
jgi:hypothetical protein